MVKNTFRIYTNYTDGSHKLGSSLGKHCTSKGKYLHGNLSMLSIAVMF